MTFAPITPLGYDPVLGPTARLALETKSGRSAIIAGERPGGSIRIEFMGDRELRFVKFDPAGTRVVDTYVRFEHGEFIGMFILEGTISSDRSFAASVGAECGKPGKYARAENRLLILCPGPTQGTFEEFSVEVTPSISFAAAGNL